MRVNESWQSRVSTADTLSYILKRLTSVLIMFSLASISYINLLKEQSSTAKQDPLTANSINFY